MNVEYKGTADLRGHDQEMPNNPRWIRSHLDPTLARRPSAYLRHHGEGRSVRKRAGRSVRKRAAA